jgi:small basic protein
MFAGTADWLLDAFAKIDPHRRRKAALWLLLTSFVLGHLNLGLFFAGLVPPEVMDAITNYLSWLAIVITALDLLIGADVRVQQEQDSET